MHGGGFYPLSRRPSLSEMEESLSMLRRWRSDFEKKLDENEGMLDENDPVQNEYTRLLFIIFGGLSRIHAGERVRF